MKINFQTLSPLIYKNNYPRVNFHPSFNAGLKEDVFVKSTQKASEINEEDKIREALPEYLYHVTSRPSYDSMLRDGKINLSHEMIEGVFLFDMNDFYENWQNTKSVTPNRNLASALVEQAIKQDTGLVVMRVATKDLDPKKFAIRKESDVIDYLHSEECRDLNREYSKKGGLFYHKEVLPSKFVKGESPIEAQKYISQGEPIEYVYKGDLPLDKGHVEKIFEWEEFSRKTLWGFGLKDFPALCEHIKFSAENA